LKEKFSNHKSSKIFYRWYLNYSLLIDLIVCKYLPYPNKVDEK
jgi:hypothetical protein